MKAQTLLDCICRHVARARMNKRRFCSEWLAGYEEGSFAEALSILQFALLDATPRKRKNAGRVIREEMQAIRTRRAEYAAKQYLPKAA